MTAASAERDLIFASLPMPLNEAQDKFAAISTEVIREMTDLPRRVLSNALLGVRYCEWDETILRDYCQLWNLDEMNLSRVQHITDRLKSLQFYEHLTPQQDDCYPLERASQAIAILKVIAHQKLHGVSGWFLVGSEPTIEHYRYIDDAKIRELLLASDYNRELVLGLILEREIFDGEELDRILKSAHPTLAQGAL